MTYLAREHDRCIAIGYVYGRIDAGDKRVDQDDTGTFADFFLSKGALWHRIEKIFEAFVAERDPELVPDRGEVTP